MQLEPDATGDAALPRKLNELAPHDGAFRRHAEMPELLDMVGQLIGEPLRLYSDQAFLKPPRQGSAKPAHQDNAHFGVDPSDWGVTVWCALDNATVANGCMQYYAGSHLLGAVPHVWRGGTTHLVPQEVDLPAPVHAPVRAGGVIFHHLLTFHMSAPTPATPGGAPTPATTSGPTPGTRTKSRSRSCSARTTRSNADGERSHAARSAGHRPRSLVGAP